LGLHEASLLRHHHRLSERVECRWLHLLVVDSASSARDRFRTSGHTAGTVRQTWSAVNLPGWSRRSLGSSVMNQAGEQVQMSWTESVQR
jgi:hypothetical protein